MVVGRRRFTVKDDVRAALTVAALGAVTLLALAALMGLVLIVVGADGGSGR